MILVAVLFGCGDLDMALSPGKAYKVNALVNGLSMDECAILSKESRISPYFDFNVRGDPDIAALVIYLKDYTGKETGFRRRYNFSIQGETDSVTVKDTTEPDSASITEDEDAESALSGKTADGGTLSTTGSLSSAGGTLSTTGDTEEDGASVIKSGTAGVDGAEEVLEPLETIITIKNFNDELPAMMLDPGMALGFYSIVFEIIAANGTLLNSVEKPFFYTAERELAVEGIVSYIPGVSSSSGIVPPGEKIMLEANINTAYDIKPYIVWYNGKHQIGEGFVNDGASRIFWNAPVQTGFQNIRVEVFPFDPIGNAPAIRGINHAVSLPVSSRHGRNGYYADMEVQISRWYRLWGNLADTKDPVSTGALLTRADDEEDPLWLPVFSTYGLAVGADDVYKLPDSLFKYVKPDEGSAEIIFRFVPRNNTAVEKPVLQAELRGADSEGIEGVCTVQLLLAENSLILQAACNEEILETRPSLPLDGDGFVSVAIDFRFFENHIEVSTGLENEKTRNVDTWERLTVNFIPNGEGGVRLGGSFETEKEEEGTAAGVSAVITEIALLYNEISPALEPVEDEEAEESEENQPENTENQTPEIPTE
ncbi:MAG: hypothetical protein LBD86_00735 [Spirochaetaceae bacterium]|nr:hypothetical protein [Spirochaetaceae bacterium]